MQKAKFQKRLAIPLRSPTNQRESRPRYHALSVGLVLAIFHSSHYHFSPITHNQPLCLVRLLLEENQQTISAPNRLRENSFALLVYLARSRDVIYFSLFVPYYLSPSVK